MSGVRLGRAALVAALALALWAFVHFDGASQLTLEALRAHMAQLQQWRKQWPLASALAYFAIYTLAAALSLPGAAVLTLAGGAVFGLAWGTLIVSFASTIGATLAFLASRFVLREAIMARYGARLAAIDAGVARDGALYLLTLRLVPAFPYFLVNLAMGLTAIRPLTFYWVSQLGMLAGTALYVNAGTELAKLRSLSDVASPSLLLSMAALGIFPLIATHLARRLAARRVYRRWRRPRRFDCNLLVIGGGAGGLVSAYIGAAVKAKVTLVESHKMGGDCLNYGCVPSKALIKSAAVAHQMRHAADYGLSPATPQVSFRAVMQRVQEVVRAIAPHDSVERYSALGVEVVQGHARLLDPWTVAIRSNDGTTERRTARSIVLATGARPAVPPLPGLEEVGYLTSDTLWQACAELDAPPARLLMLGGGPIGCELAQALARLGSHVTQVEMAPRLMVREDEEVSALVTQALERDGVTVLTGSHALRCEREGERKFIVLAGVDGEQRIEFDVLVCATGRSARLSGYGLEELGIDAKRTIPTNDYLETLYPNIHAAGDVTGPYQFTHVAAHQAWYAAVNALFGSFKRFKVDYSVIPWTTFTAPEVARVGVNELEARQRKLAYEVTRFELHELDRAITDGATEGFIKVLTAPGRDRILGVTIVGAQAGELLAEFVLAMKHGLGLNKILGTIHSYPTLAEANKYVAGQWKRAHVSPRVLAWLAHYHRWQRGQA